MSDPQTRPFLINKDVEGNYRLTVRDIYFNSQGYMLVKAVLRDELFKTAGAARTFAVDNFNAKPGQYASK